MRTRPRMSLKARPSRSAGAGPSFRTRSTRHCKSGRSSGRAGIHNRRDKLEANLELSSAPSNGVTVRAFDSQIAKQKLISVRVSDVATRDNDSHVAIMPLLEADLAEGWRVVSIHPVGATSHTPHSWAYGWFVVLLELGD